MSDPLADGMNNGREIVGSAASPAVYTYSDGVDFFVRLRVDEDPSQADAVRPFGWGLLIDTDGDFAAYEFSLLIDGTGNPKSVVLSQNTSPGTTGDPSDRAELVLNTSAVNTAAGGNVQISLADTSFNADADYFLDFSVPLSALKSAGISLGTAFRVVAGTSSNGNSISVDVAGTGTEPGPGVLQEAASDPIFLDGSTADSDGDGVLNPTDLDDDNDGILDSSENLLGAGPDADRDADGVPNWRDATDQGNNTVSACADSAEDGVCDAPSGVYDRDRDGVANHLDLDSDDDGIPDIKEAGHRAADANNDGLVDAPYGGNGYVNSLETLAESGLSIYPLLDTDNDSIPDVIDLDSDADGAFDLTEIGKSTLDTNSDGRIDASAADVDQDGLRAGVDANDASFGHPLIVVGTFNADTDGIPDPYDPVAGNPSDSDSDGLSDAIECVGGWPCPDTNLDGTPNYMTGVDTDGDGVTDNADSAPLDPTLCRDVDTDTCDDCAVTGADGSGGSVTNDGLDTDTDGTCNAGELDDDNDGVLDTADSAPLNPNLCKDTDADTCDDCAVTGANASGGSVTNDGLDTDADGSCNAGDLDDDNDGVGDAGDSRPLDPLICRDTDGDTCDDCAVTGANASGGNPLNDGLDSDSDGICDRALDSDEDGVLIPVDLDADNDGIPNNLENLLGIDPLADADQDSIPNFVDVSNRGDGQAATCVDANANGRCDVLDPSFDTDRDGVPNHLDLDSDGDTISDLDEAGHAGVDAARDGMVDGAVGANGIVNDLETAIESGVINYERSNVDADEAPDFLDADTDGDGITDANEAGDAELATIPVDTDADTIADYRDPDADNDSISDRDEAGDADLSTPAVDTNQDGTADYIDDDSDGDGVSDATEAGDADPATPPLNSDQDTKPDFQDSDSDEDGVLDGVDNCRLVANAEQQDEDTDGVGDACEGDSDTDGVLDPVDNCPAVSNAGQEDEDSDGVGDACELAPALDSDGDSVPDADDNCPDVRNPRQQDADDDGQGDACEPAAQDSDDDGVADADDNCAELANPDQEDTDGDGTGDACDEPDAPAPADDDDGDGIADGEDNCPTQADPSQADRDDDGLGDVCDRDANGDGFDDELGVQGGGCSVSVTGGGGSAWSALLLGALGVALAGRGRRKRRAARAAMLGLGIGSLFVNRNAQAQDVQVPAERFRLASTREGILDVESGKVGNQASFDAGIWVGYADDPLTVYRERNGERERVGSLVGRRFGSAFVAALALTERLQMAITVPFVLSQQGSFGDGMPNATPDSFGLGNVELAPKLQILEQAQAGLDLALLVGVMLPTTSSNDYFGDSSAVATPELALSGNFGAGVHGGLNVGYRFRNRAQLLNLVVDDEINARAGLAYRFKDLDGPPLELALTGATATAAGDPFATPNRDYAEVMGGIAADIVSTKERLTTGWQVFGAGGVGVARGFGTPDFRALIGLRLSLAPAKEPPPAPAPIVEKDTDQDGFLDKVDKCPDQPEVKNGFEDDDGCPDEIPDTDGDGLRDPQDKCPTEPEDRDNFQDSDGCPDPDNDGDTILDAQDRCPLEPGPKVTFGCPDPDRDKDTVVDRLDNCPDEPGKPELQGCQEKQLVRIVEDRIEILEVVHFDYNKAVIQRRSFKLLDSVARVIVAHPELNHIRVEGHTDDKGNDAYNKKLSQSRAEAVLRYLAGQGVAAERLHAVGFGEEKPMGENASEAGRAANRRVEFRIVAPEATKPSE